MASQTTRPLPSVDIVDSAPTCAIEPMGSASLRPPVPLNPPALAGATGYNPGIRGRSEVRQPRERSRHVSSPTSRAVTAKVPLTRSVTYNNEDPDAYEMLTKPRGYCLIINNEDFSDSPLEHTSRVGSQFDAESIKALFEELYFDVEHWHNLDYLDMKQRIREFARKEEHKTANACFVFIMSHGAGNRGEDSFWSCDGRVLPISWIEDQFNNENAPFLLGKPKVLVLHCCRGEEFDYGVRSAHHHLRDEEEGGETIGRSQSDGHIGNATPSGRLPAVTDMLVAYSTVPGKVSMRDVDRGTWYIQILCRTIREYAHDHKLRDILDKASHELAKHQGECGKMQASEYTVRTFRNLYFNPLMWHEDDFLLCPRPSEVANGNLSVTFELPESLAEEVAQFSLEEEEWL